MVEFGEDDGTIAVHGGDCFHSDLVSAFGGTLRIAFEALVASDEAALAAAVEAAAAQALVEAEGAELFD